MPDITQIVHNPSMRTHRFHFLDGMRGVAAIVVVLFHIPAEVRLWPAMRQAWLAVDFFFLLSGFVIALSYQSRLTAGMRLRDFAAARLIRLYPLYLAGTLFGLISVVVVDSLSTHVNLSLPDLAFSLPPALLLIPNFPNHWPYALCFPFDLPAWSLFLEVFANLLFACLLRWRAGHTAVLASLAAASFLVLAIAARHGLPDLGVGFSLPSLPLSLARVGLSFFAGVLVFRFFQSRPRPSHPALTTWLFPIVSALGLLTVLAVSSTLTATIGYQFVVVILVFPTLLYLGACSQTSARISQLCALLGDLSYPLYILHAPFVFPLDGSHPRAFLARHVAAAPWLLLGVVVVFIAFSWFAARYPDRSVRLLLTRYYNAANT